MFTHRMPRIPHAGPMQKLPILLGLILALLLIGEFPFFWGGVGVPTLLLTTGDVFVYIDSLEKKQSTQIESLQMYLPSGNLSIGTNVKDYDYWSKLIEITNELEFYFFTQECKVLWTSSLVGNCARNLGTKPKVNDFNYWSRYPQTSKELDFYFTQCRNVISTRSLPLDFTQFENLTKVLLLTMNTLFPTHPMHIVRFLLFDSQRFRIIDYIGRLDVGKKGRKKFIFFTFSSCKSSSHPYLFLWLSFRKMSRCNTDQQNWRGIQ